MVCMISQSASGEIGCWWNLEEIALEEARVVEGEAEVVQLIEGEEEEGAQPRMI